MKNDNDWKQRLGVVYSTNPDFKYQTAEVAEANTLPPAKQRLIVAIDRPGGIHDEKYVFCNWGCSGTSNGLYSDGLFNFYLGNYSNDCLIITGIEPY